MNPADITAAISQLARLLEQQRRLWTVDDVAEYMQLSVVHVRDRVAHQPGFPAAITIGHARRWRPEDVRAWAESRKGKAA